jgi:predicted unusual protein kinase regulating ubiquinone biosynthesis (AarF/ABC1/UbiB family)
MSDLPRRAFVRSAKLATLPIGFAGRATLGIGKRLGGTPAEVVLDEVQRRTAEQLFQVLGQLKGGAMKFGQALSVIEAALPESLAAPYRAALTKLQESAPPMPVATVHRVLTGDLGPDWRSRFKRFDDVPTAAASIGQVHRAQWADGRLVAVKVQYPGAGPALLNDFTQLGRLARMFAVLSPGLDIKPLLSELRERLAEELDYRLEAASQEAFATAYDDDPDILVPHVVHHTEHVLVTDWVSGTPLAAIIRDGSAAQRDRAGLAITRFLFSGPSRAGLLHADPHPGNFRLLADGRLAVLDFGAVSHLPGGLPRSMGMLCRLALDGNAAAVRDGLRAEGFIRDDQAVSPEDLLDFLGPLIAPLAVDEFSFDREWLRGEATRVADRRSPTSSLARRLNLPPSYLLIHRVTIGTFGVLSQLGATVAVRDEARRLLPGFSE